MRILFTVTNDLSYDQRMQRICGSLACNGYEVLLIGRLLPHSIPLSEEPFGQKRFRCLFKRGPLFYAEYNIRLFLFLLFSRHWEAICSIDLDTLPAGYLAALLRGKKRVYDAHEYFTQVPELVGRPRVQAVWEWLAGRLLPRYRFAYTIGPGFARLLEKQYGLHFSVIRNVPLLQRPPETEGKKAPFIILYQGALNEGRGLEAAISAMQGIEGAQLLIAGEGDLSEDLRRLAQDRHLTDRVRFLGYLPPADLKKYTEKAWLGINLLENKGLSYYYSLANKFFDYVQAGVPQITMDFPEYRAHNEQFEVARLLPDLSEKKLQQAILDLLKDKNAYNRLASGCCKARLLWNWQEEERELLRFWKEVMG